MAEYKYDGAKRRNVKEIYSAGTLDETRHFFYTEPSKWQVVEERVESSSDAERQFVWGLRYIDDILARDRDTTGNGVRDEWLYGMQDANWNVTTISGSNGSVKERLYFDAYGNTMVLTTEFALQDISAYAWETRFAGYRHDESSGLLHVRHRFYQPTIAVWLQRDPLLTTLTGTVVVRADEHLYLYTGANPTVYVDPSGEVWWVPVVVGLGGCVAGIGLGLIPSPGRSGLNRACRGLLGCMLGAGTAVGALLQPAFAGCIAGLGVGAIRFGTNPLCDYLVDGIDLTFRISRSGNFVFSVCWCQRSLAHPSAPAGCPRAAEGLAS